MLLTEDTALFLKRGLRRGMQQITRDRTWGTTVTLLSALMILMQLLMVFLLGVQAVNRLLISRAAIQLEVLPGAADQEIQELYASLRAQSFVDHVAYVPSEKAYELQRQRDPELVAFLEEYSLDNPFPDTIEVTLATLGEYDTLTQFIQQDRWRTVINPSYLSSVTAQEREIRSLLQVTSGIRTLTVLFLCVAFAVLCFVVIEWAARATHRRSQEIMLENLLGAPPVAVLLPFVTEMTILLLSALFIGTVLVALFLFVLPLFLPALALESAYGEVSGQILPLLTSVFPLLLLFEILLLPALSAGGTVLGTRKKLLWPARLLS